MFKVPTFVYVMIALLVLSGGAVWYYKSTQAQIMQLTANNATLTSNVARITDINVQNVKALDDLSNAYQDVQLNYNGALDDLQLIRESNNKLNERLGKHDIGALASAKPGLVERVVNNASKKAFRCMEILSGAPLKDNERNATNGKSFNSECPWLFNDTVADTVAK